MFTGREIGTGLSPFIIQKCIVSVVNLRKYKVDENCKNISNYYYFSVKT